MGEFFKYFRKILIKAGSQHNGVAAPLFLLLGLEFERFFSALDELSHLFLMFAKRWVVLEFIVDVAAYSGKFFVEVFGKSLYGLAHKFVEVEAHTAYGFAQ